MKINLLKYILIFFTLSGNLLSGQDVKVDATLDTSKIWLGDHLNYSFVIEQPADLSLKIPVLKDTLCKSVEILAGPLIDSAILDGNRIRIKGSYLITSFDSGFYEIPPFYAELREETGVKRYYSDYNYLEVLRVRIAPADTTTKIFDIIEPYKAPLSFSEVIPWIFLVALVIIAAWLAWKYARRLFRPSDQPEIAVLPDPAHIIAFRELEILKNEELWQKNQLKTYYSRLTEIVRSYLDNRFNVNSLELTTSETLEALVRKGFKQDGPYNKLKEVLTSADMVKFAKFIPGRDDHTRYFEMSWSFVDETMEKTDASVAPESGERKEAEL